MSERSERFTNTVPLTQGCTLAEAVDHETTVHP